MPNVLKRSGVSVLVVLAKWTTRVACYSVIAVFTSCRITLCNCTAHVAFGTTMKAFDSLICGNSVTTVSQKCHKSVTTVSQHCHNNSVTTTLSQQRHNNNVTTTV